LHVLVADDDPDARDLFRLVLVYYGATVTIVTTARAALDALQRVRADVVITGLVREGSEDGVWLLGQARSRWPHVPFIATCQEQGDAELRATVGFVECLIKPTQPELVVDAILAAVGQPALSQLRGQP
jgi:two-component system CheB/CheR fusion protein